MAFRRAYPPASAPAGRAWHIPFGEDGRFALDPETGSFLLRDALPVFEALYLGDRDGIPVVAYTVPTAADDDQISSLGLRVDLRGAISQLPVEDAHLAGYAAQLIAWRRLGRHCPVCGAATDAGELWSRLCPSCGHNFYPPVSPAVLLLVHDGGDRVLLAQKPGWGKRYSILAGFVEPGESLEACCHREAEEEAGVQIALPEYVGSQPWPFPHQLMVAFSARHVGGEIRPDMTELSDARWFTLDDLPELPPPHSLSRQTIDLWIESRIGR